ncbi:hypothetical protein [Paraburkholderia phosphatilytica]|uniref:hypothetical protein n=1 Tax=Paraburkholderia phosphatilytica TaxID=2282883 RepID=UPI001F0C252F|nr:hypothetical protein [Paraburkholderia phosphatilytica]
MRASFTHAVHDTAALAQVAGRENGERNAASKISAPEPAAASGCDAKIVRIGHAAPTAGSIAHPGMDYENGARLTIRAIETQRRANGERGRRSPPCAYLSAAGPQTGTHDAAALEARGSRQACRKLARQPRAIPTKITSVRPDLIEYGRVDATGVPSARQTATRGGRAQIPDGDGVYSARVATQAQAARRLVRPEAAVALRGMDTEAHFDRQHEAEAHFHTPVQIDAPFTYDALYVIVDAMKRANSIDAPKVLAAMPVTGYTGVAGHIAFDDKGGLKEGAIARRDMAGGGDAVSRRHGHAMTGFTLGGTDPSDGAVFASASGGFASIPIEAGRFRAVNP